MAHPRLSTLALILTVFLCAAHTQAQQANSTPETTDTPNAALREKAFALLESVAGQLSTLQSGENRARLGANIVDSLWKHDEKRARALLALVQDDIKAGLEHHGNFDEKELYTFMVFSKLRLDTVERIAKYDGESALALLKATEPILDKRLPEGLVRNEREIELRLAKQIGGKNPDLTLKLARKSLERSLTPEVVYLVLELNKKHKEQALILYKDIISKISEKDIAADWDIRYFVETLVRAIRPPAIDTAAFRELAAVITTQALAYGCANKISDEDDRSAFCHWISSIIPNVEKLDARAARLKRWQTEEDEGENLSQAVYEMNLVMRTGEVDDLLSLASKYPESAEQIYQSAMYWFVNTGDFERARKIVNENIRDDEKRQDMLLKIDLAQKAVTFDEQKLAEVQARLNEIPNPREKAMFLLSVSGGFGVIDQKAAIKLTNQAREIIDNMNPGKDQTQSQINLAMVYCLQKNDRGFAIMESLLPKLNELVEVAAKLDGYDTSYLRNGEWNMSANGPIGELLTLLAQNASYFAWCDFDRAVSLAAQFDRSEIRLMAQVKLAQGILSGPPKRPVQQPYAVFQY